jgi:hypothetical protein
MMEFWKNGLGSMKCWDLIVLRVRVAHYGLKTLCSAFINQYLVIKSEIRNHYV